MSKAKMQAAKELIEEKKYDEARSILATVDHPTAREWEKKLDLLQAQASKISPQTEKVESTTTPSRKKRRLLTLPVIGGILLACILVYIVAGGPQAGEQRRATQTAQAVSAAHTNTVIALTPPTETNTSAPSGTPTVTQTSAPTATITDTPKPSATFTPSNTPFPTETPVFNEQEAAQQIIDGLSIVAGGRNIETVQVADGRPNGGERVVIVSYLTTESTEVGYVDEWIDIFEGVAASIRANDLDVDSVSLVAGTATGQAAGILVTSIEDLIAFTQGEITRGEFLSRLQSTTF